MIRVPSSAADGRGSSSRGGASACRRRRSSASPSSCGQPARPAGLRPASRSASRSPRRTRSPGVTCITSLASQCGAPLAVVGRDLHLHQRRVPLVREDGRPQQPQPRCGRRTAWDWYPDSRAYRRAGPAPSRSACPCVATRRALPRRRPCARRSRGTRSPAGGRRGARRRWRSGCASARPEKTTPRSGTGAALWPPATAPPISPAPAHVRLAHLFVRSGFARWSVLLRRPAFQGRRPRNQPRRFSITPELKVGLPYFKIETLVSLFTRHVENRLSPDPPA